MFSDDMQGLICAFKKKKYHFNFAGFFSTMMEKSNWGKRNLNYAVPNFFKNVKTDVFLGKKKVFIYQH